MKRIIIIGIFFLLSCEGKPPVKAVISDYELIKDNILASHPHIIVNAQGTPELVYLNEETRQAEFGIKSGNNWTTSKIAPAYPLDEIGDLIISLRESEIFSAHDSEIGALVLFERTLAGWMREVIDDTGNTGFGSKIIEDRDGGLHIFYTNNSTMDLIHTYIIAGKKTTETVDPGYIGMTGGGKVMPHLSAVMKGDGRPFVIYYENYYGLLKTASMNEDGMWNIETIEDVEGGRYPFIITSTSCNCLKVAYYNESARTLLYLEKRENWTSERPDTSNYTLGIHPIIIEKNDRTFVFYLNRTNFALRVGVKYKNKWNLYEISIYRPDKCPFMVSDYTVTEHNGIFRIVLVDHINREVGYVEKSVDDF